MPHVSEFHATSDHDRHDLLLVAALAAGDVSGIDRDHALDLTRSCATCADLHDDLVAIARATASVPPPITTRPRDFRLTAADAARLRPAGWRRLVGTFAGFQALATRPVGVGLATLGLVGLLVGNAPALPIGGAPSAPTAAEGAPNAASGAEDAAGGRSSVGGGPQAVSVPAASAAASARTAFGSEATGALSSSAPGASDQLAAEPAPAASGGLGGSSSGNGTVKTASTPVPTATDGTREPESSDSSSFRPLNLLFGAAVLVGLGVLVASRFRSRSAV